MDFIKLLLEKLHLKGLILYIYGLMNRDRYIADREQRKIFFMMTPSYGNLGDQAISYATICFLQDNFSDYKVIEVRMNDTYSAMPSSKKAYRPGDIILLQGGGNMGNLWQYIEDFRRFIMSQLHSCKIVSMPVTVTFTDDRKGKRELRKSQKIYSKCKDLTIIAREKYSFDFLIKNFGAHNIILSPDIVFYLQDRMRTEEKQRRGSILCLRHDIESVNKNTLDKFVADYAHKYPDFKIYDTSVVRLVNEQTREAEVQAALNEISDSEYMITDRMHGLVFAFLTKTPCIITTALDKKILGTFEWIKDEPGIIYTDRIPDRNELDEIIKALREAKAGSKRINLKKKFSNLRNQIMNSKRV